MAVGCRYFTQSHCALNCTGSPDQLIVEWHDYFVAFVFRINLYRDCLFVEHNLNGPGCPRRIDFGCRCSACYPFVNPFGHLTFDQESVASVSNISTWSRKDDYGASFFVLVLKWIEPEVDVPAGSWKWGQVETSGWISFDLNHEFIINIGICV